MICTECRRQFHEGDRVTYVGLSIYHEFAIPGMDNVQHAVEKPHAVMSIKHLCCEDD